MSRISVPCSVEGCPSLVLARSVCGRHYQKLLKYGDPLGTHTRPSPRSCSVAGCTKQSFGKSYCATHYTRFYRHGDPHIVVKPRAATGTPVEDRFWPLVHKTDSCWIWTGFIGTGGYGRFTIRHGEQIGAHRLSWVLANGAIEDPTMEVAHNCPGGDNPSCVNPAHLMLLTPKEHGADRLAKGQTPTGDRSGPRLHPESMPRGEHQHFAKFTEQQIMELRARFDRGCASKRGLAREFHVTPRTIRLIVERVTWTHLP